MAASPGPLWRLHVGRCGSCFAAPRHQTTLYMSGSYTPMLRQLPARPPSSIPTLGLM